MSFYIIENKKQLENLIELKDVFLNIIPNNPFFHPKLQLISLIYIKPLKGKNGYMLCFNHNESNSLNINDFKEWIINNTNKIFVLDKKRYLYNFYYIHNKIYNLYSNEIEQIDSYRFYNKLLNNNYLNNIIPISKHFEYHEYIFKKTVIKLLNKFDINNYQDEDIYNFFIIENNGIKVDKKEFNKHYSYINNHKFNINKSIIYTQYNLNTLTKRPTNIFNHINFLALNKNNNERKCFIPKNEIFIEFDISAYHPRLIAELLNFQFYDNDVYNFLEMDKQEVFHNIYGYIRNENKTKPFFKELNLWLLKNNKTNKELSHIIQYNETVNNNVYINNINKFLNNKKSKLILYTYDAFLLDASNNEIEDIIYYIKNLIKYPLKIKIGKNYQNLEKYE